MTFLLEHWVWTSVAVVLLVLLGIAIHDIFQTKHAIKHNFPIVGHLRYFLEMVGPEMRQYWVANDKEERPFNRDERSWVYASAKGQNNTFGFGTTEEIYEVGYPIIKHAAFPYPDSLATYPGKDPTAIPCAKIMGEAHSRKSPFRPGSVINISAMSYGSLGKRAISALNLGAKEAGCFHNTGEGGVSEYHCLGADLMWQIGTGYFGARDSNGKFSFDVAAQRVEEHPQIRCIEVKLSQGAKPGKGGILPAAKISAEIARIRGIKMGEACCSPNAHSEFGTVDELIQFIETLADATGVPVGIKSAIGAIDFWEELAVRMKERKQGPDFISIDGAEGGTGAAPLTFADHVALPFKVGFSRVYPLFQRYGLTEDIIWSGSAKLGFPDRTVIAFAMGCDIIQVAREAMLSIGCIQAQRCHTGHCPAGVATQNWWLQAGINIDEKANRFARYVQVLRKELISLAHAAGYEHPGQVTGDDIEVSTGVNEFSTLSSILGYTCDKIQVSQMKDLTAV